MRPAYRFSLAALVVVAVIGAAALLSATGRRAPPPGPGALAAPGAEHRPARAKASTAANPAVPEVLDGLQADEAHELGAQEAERRRRVREQLIRARSGAGPDGRESPR